MTTQRGRVLKREPNYKESATFPKKKWSDRNMVNAVYAVENNILTMYAAAQIYSIPRKTLKNYIKKEKVKEYLAIDDIEVIETKLKEDEVKIKTEEGLNVDLIDTDTSWFNIQSTWYCHACKMDRMADMRQCSKCCRWYHEACVGLTVDDMDPFECPIGC